MVFTVLILTGRAPTYVRVQTHTHTDENPEVCEAEWLTIPIQKVVRLIIPASSPARLYRDLNSSPAEPVVIFKRIRPTNLLG